MYTLNLLSFCFTFDYLFVLLSKNLGFIFDHQLNMDEQIKTVSQICYLNLRSLRRIARHLSYELKIQLVNSNILSFLDYCNAVYGGISDKNLSKLQKIQNNGVRFIFKLVGKHKFQSIKPYLKRLHFLPVEYRIYFKIALLVFKCINNLAPKYLKDLISIREINNYGVRLDNDFYILRVPKVPNLSSTSSAFSFIGPDVWNKLPFNIRCISDLSIFKRSLKRHYFNLAFEDIPDI